MQLSEIIGQYNVRMLLFDMSIIQNWKLNADESGTSGHGKLKNLIIINKYE